MDTRSVICACTSFLHYRGVASYCFYHDTDKGGVGRTQRRDAPLVNPCNCFGRQGQYETDMAFHEMGSGFCSRGVPSNPGSPTITMYEEDHDHIMSRETFMGHGDDGASRTFATGALRDTAVGKPDYEGFLSPLVLHAYGIHMMRHQTFNGEHRPSDNWQNGIPKDIYMKSMWRHFFDVWANHRRYTFIRKERIITAICALLFNVMGYLHEYLKENPDALKSFEEIA